MKTTRTTKLTTEEKAAIDARIKALPMPVLRRLALGEITLEQAEAETATEAAHVPEQYLTYLDDLRRSGATNMFGAGPYLQRDFGLTKADARRVLLYWMQTFAERHREETTR